MPEWPNGAVSKTVIQVTVSRVRIPVFPHKKELCRNNDTALFLDIRYQISDIS